VKRLELHRVVNEIVSCLADVETHMSNLHNFVGTQENGDKPLYQWAKYGGYPALTTAVSELEDALAKLKAVQPEQDYLATSALLAMSTSTSVSTVAAYTLAVINKETAKYMEEMKSSTLTSEAKLSATAIITEESKKLIEHATRATKSVWVTVDMLRDLNQERLRSKDRVWSAATIVMTIVISAVVGTLASYLCGPAGLDIGSKSGHSGGMHTQAGNFVQRIQVISDTTDRLYTIKMEDLDHYSDLATLAESNSLRIDNLVEALGPPNQEGNYYPSMRNANSESCEHVKARLQKVSDDTNCQLQRLHEDMEIIRKNMNRMDIRLTRSINKIR
jgi:hypothetical protein